MKTYAMPLAPGADLPQLPAVGINSETDLPHRATLQVIDHDLSPGPTSQVYAFSKRSVHRNLFQIPVP